MVAQYLELIAVDEIEQRQQCFALVRMGTPWCQLLSLVRQGEGYHNETQNWSLEDPRLTDKGRKQAQGLTNYQKSKLVLVN